MILRSGGALLTQRIGTECFCASTVLAIDGVGENRNGTHPGEAPGLTLSVKTSLLRA